MSDDNLVFLGRRPWELDERDHRPELAAEVRDAVREYEALAAALEEADRAAVTGHVVAVVRALIRNARHLGQVRACLRLTKGKTE